MFCRVLALDFDGTAATDGRLAPELEAALGTARAQGILAVLVTGRVLEDLLACGVDPATFDGIVAENGAVVFLPHRDRTVVLGTPPSERLLGALRERGVPFHAGAIVVGTWDQHTADVLRVVRELGVDAQLSFNRSAVMLLPSGINKAVGTVRALQEIGRSPRNMIAFGDAENDHALLQLAEIGIAAHGAVPTLAASADAQLSDPGGAGVARHVRGVLEAGCVSPTPRRRSVLLGEADDGPVTLPASGGNVMISGDPRSGKSWLAGLIAEQLLDGGYSLCVIDPEGEHLTFSNRPSVLAFGHGIPLPQAAAVSRVLRSGSSVVVSLAEMPEVEQPAYVDELLTHLEAARAADGLPQWIIIDEAHCFFGGQSSCAQRLSAVTGNFVLVTYRPSLISVDAYANVSAYLVTSTTVDDERYVIASLLAARGPRERPTDEALGALVGRHTGLLVTDPAAPQWRVFTPGVRRIDHTHHARKYADRHLPQDKAFHFRFDNGRSALVASNLAEFYAAIGAVPLASIRLHLAAHDFSRWAQGVLGDETLARGLRKIERTVAGGASPNRGEILALIERLYDI